VKNIFITSWCIFPLMIFGNPHLYLCQTRKNESIHFRREHLHDRISIVHLR